MVSALSAKIAQFIYSEDLIWCSVKILCNLVRLEVGSTEIRICCFTFFISFMISPVPEKSGSLKMPEMPSAAQSVHEEVSFL